MSDDPSVPEAGTYAVDYRDGSVGQVMGCEGGLVQLRPLGGGREWDCPPGSVGEAPPAEAGGPARRNADRALVRDGRRPRYG